MPNYFKILDIPTQTHLDDNNEPSIAINFNQSQIFEELLTLFQTNITRYVINEYRNNKIQQFIDTSTLAFNKESIYNSIFWLNQCYYESVQLSNSFIICSLDKEAEELKILSDIISAYFGTDGLNLKSIAFKFEHNTNAFDRKITNKLVMLDIMNAIKNHVPTKLYNESIPISRNTKRPQYTKHITAKVIKKHLLDNNPKSSENSLHRFIIDFFHNAQVPISVEDKELLDDNPGLISNILNRWKE